MATTDKPKAAMDSLETHSTSAGNIAESVDSGKKSKAAASIDDAAKGIEEKPAEDNSLFARMARSGLVYVRDHTSGQDYVGIPPSQDENATDASKRLSAVIPLSTIGPRTGMRVIPKDGEPFQIGEGFGLDANPDRWEGVTNPKTGKALFAA